MSILTIIMTLLMLVLSLALREEYQDPINAATVENGVAAQEQSGILDQIKRDTNKEGGDGVFETEVLDDAPYAYHLDNHQVIHRYIHETQSDIYSYDVGARSYLAG